MTSTSIDVVVTWAGTPLAIERLAPGETFTIGAAPPQDRHFVCDHEHIGVPRFPLVENGESGVVVRTAEGMGLVVDGKHVASPEMVLPRGGRAIVRVGPLEVSIGADRRAPRALAGWKDRVDERLLRLSGIALVVHAGFVIALLVTRVPERPLDDLDTLRARWTKTVHTTPPPRTVARTVEKVVAAAAASAAREPRERKPRKPGGDLRAMALSFVKELTGGASPSSVFGEKGPTLTGLRGQGDGVGEAGLGLRDVGGGGGGDRQGIGGIDGRIGSGDGCDDCDVELATRKKPATVVPRPPVITDGLSRDEIQRVITRVMSRIKHCYESELQSDPGLEGKLVTTWTIAPSGLVEGARVLESGLASASVGGCVVRVISRLQFPAPAGGGQVFVTYPFVFQTAGE